MQSDKLEIDIDHLQLWQERWKKYKYWILWGVTVLLIAFALFQYAERYQARKVLAASNLYQEWSGQRSHLSANENQRMIQQLQQQYPRTAYAQIATFFLVQQLVEQQDYDDALKQLAWIKQKASDRTLQHLAALRMARILLLQKKYTEALALVDTLSNRQSAAAANEIKGDIYLAMGDKKQAHIAYQEAWDQPGSHPTLLFMKLNNTAIALDNDH